jgi:hypothetical protein
VVVVVVVVVGSSSSGSGSGSSSSSSSSSSISNSNSNASDFSKFQEDRGEHPLAASAQRRMCGIILEDIPGMLDPQGIY